MVGAFSMLPGNVLRPIKSHGMDMVIRGLKTSYSEIYSQIQDLKAQLERLRRARGW